MAAADCAGNGSVICWEEVALAVFVCACVRVCVCVCLSLSLSLSVCDVFAFFLLQCNNPKTKEPKLTAAARIVPEWVEYDNEIKQLLRRAQQREDTATQSPSTSPHKKGEQQHVFCTCSAFLPHC